VCQKSATAVAGIRERGGKRKIVSKTVGGERKEGLGGGRHGEKKTAKDDPFSARGRITVLKVGGERKKERRLR